MRSHATRTFWREFQKLDAKTRKLAIKQYRIWRVNPSHPSLHFKKVGRNVWSARVCENVRALATPIEGGYVWFWIGSHDEYQRFMRSG